MSVFAAAAKVLASLAALGQQGTGLGLDFSGWSGSEPGAEGYAATATNTAGDIGGLVAPFTGKMIAGYFKSLSPLARMNLTNQMGGPQGAKEFAKGLSIISWTITAVQLLQLTTGFGTPYDGASLKTGSQQFTTLAEQLKSALPDAGWEGEASEAYAGQDKSLQNIAQTMADLDNQLAALVKNQADWVTHMHLAFGILNDVLLAALVIEVILTFTVPAPAGPVVAKVFAITVASLGISAAVAFLGTLLGYSIENGKKADALADSYAAMAAGTVHNDSVAESKVAALGGSTVSSFEAVSARLSDTPVSAGGPTASPPAADERVEQRGRPDVSLGAAGPGGAPAPAAPAAAPAAAAAPDYASVSTPTGTMPTLVQAAAMSGQTTSLSSRVSKPESLVNQAKMQLADIAGMVAQEREPVMPELLTEEAAGAGYAAAGASPVGPAPIEVEVTRDEPAQRPTTV
ncbi:hypothetical protein AWC05_07205 [Mycobacterium florentinum]|uniref:ESX-1 secretion-associated protein EspA/EspE-like domain-containing protein n=1 Tax=Mycobacterium florentinum TaxID=292462 RepID=A0A1X1TUP6_MYCFL|nr:EspA/EspE family type VII secretion system effector [Mycobacterium florentinum]MCV7408883.1 hypothetical protein [Mycobacterium florentinum]ORV48303.1 hypothetical protein AWC05_07205 [Mycobacterium florentinum]BBX77677.1 hypothetical protein MFLOJ_14640 [Mycobacterium florentinum]